MRPLLPLLVVAAVAFCPGCSTPPAAGSGIEGHVTLGPTCPVEHNPPEPQCADRPYKADLEALRGGQAVRFFSSDANGTFRVALDPGDYEIQSTESSAHVNCASQGVVHVVARQFTRADVRCDSGIR